MQLPSPRSWRRYATVLTCSSMRTRSLIPAVTCLGLLAFSVGASSPVFDPHSVITIVSVDGRPLTVQYRIDYPDKPSSVHVTATPVLVRVHADEFSARIDRVSGSNDVFVKLSSTSAGGFVDATKASAKTEKGAAIFVRKTAHGSSVTFREDTVR